MNSFFRADLSFSTVAPLLLGSLPGTFLSSYLTPGMPSHIVVACAMQNGHVRHTLLHKVRSGWAFPQARRPPPIWLAHGLQALTAPEPDGPSLRSSAPILRSDGQTRKSRSATLSSGKAHVGRGSFSSWAETVQVLLIAPHAV